MRRFVFIWWLFYGLLIRKGYFYGCLYLFCRENGTANGTAAAVTTPVTAATTAEVILHQFPRNQFGPSPSPFALKLETYLRLAKITYAVCRIFTSFY